MNSQYRNIDRPDVPQAVTVQFVLGETYDEHPDLSHLTQSYKDVKNKRERARFQNSDAARLQAYERGLWHMRGLWVEARINAPIGGGSFAMYTLRSPGLWGVESDCGAEYEREVYREEETQLRRALKQMAEAFAGL